MCPRPDNKPRQFDILPATANTSCILTEFVILAPSPVVVELIRERCVVWSEIRTLYETRFSETRLRNIVLETHSGRIRLLRSMGNLTFLIPYSRSTQDNKKSRIKSCTSCIWQLLRSIRQMPFYFIRILRILTTSTTSHAMGS